MRKIFLKLSMLLFVLGMGTNAAWAGGVFDPSQLPPEMIQTLLTPTYCAQLTGHASSTGGGKVYVNAPQAGQSASDDPRETPYVEGESNVAVSGMGMSMSGMTKIGINAWAKADPGYWFAGFSFSNMGTDLGTTTDENMPGMYVNSYDIGALANETIEYDIYGTFEPIRFAGYEITGNATTASDGEGNMVCNLAVIFTPSGAAVDIDAADFKTPTVTGTGWSLVGWDYNTSNAGKVTVNVRFSTTSTAVAEYTGSLKLETMATPAVSMNVPLNARTAAASDIEAIRYNKNKVKQGEGTLAAMIAAADPTDVIKLNKNYNGQVVATKSFILDLNGYNIEHHYNTARAGEFDEAAIAQAALLVYNPDAVVTIAYSPYGGEIIAGPFNDAADVFGKLVLNGGTLSGFFGVGSVGVVEQNGATINGSQYSSCAIASMGKVTITDGKMNAMVGSKGDDAELIINGGIIDNTVIAEPMSGTPGHGVQIGGGICRINKGTIIGRTFGVQNTSVGGGDITIEKLAVIKGGESSYALDCGGGTTTVNCGKFEDPAKLWDPYSIEERLGDGRAVFGSCYFQTNNQDENAYWGQHVWRNTSGAEYREGYEFFVGPSDAAKAAGVSVCHIGGTSYSSLEDAIDYANNTSEEVVIIMDNDYTLPAGYYTIPSNATLLIPMSNEQGAATAIVSRERAYTTPSLFRKLTLASGVNIDVFGVIEVSGKQYSGHNGQEEGNHTGAVIESYAQLQMNQGSKIVLQNNSVLRAWGYVTGDVEHKDDAHHVPMGEIDVRRGATVYELFQLGDWGNTVMNGLGLVSGDSRFPITCYFIQNVEVPAKYHPGGRLTSVTTVSAAGGGMNMTMCANDIQIIGVTGVDVAMFLMNQEDDAENTWVRKWYDASKDQQVYEVNSAAHIGNLVLNLASSPLFEGLEETLPAMAEASGNKTLQTVASLMGLVPDAEFHQDLIMNSGQYVLPITSNFKLHLLSGTLDFTQSTELLPGSELEIDKEATVYVTDQDDPDVREGSLYIYDWRDWDESAAEGGSSGDAPAKKIAYVPSFDDGINNGVVPDDVRDVSTCEALGHAKINVHGTFDTYQGYIFTSGGNDFDPEHGGNIFSSVEDAGTFMFHSAAKAADYSESVKIKANGNETVTFYPAYLKNADGTYVHTGGTEAGKSYCFIDFNGTGGQWKSLTLDGCFTRDDTDPEHPVYYIKPQEYVAVTSNIEDPATHTYSDLAGTGRLFIQLTDEEGFCQWWEVEAKDNYFHCIHPENDTYYEWDNTRNEWKEKKFTITWKDWDGSTITTYSVSYGTQAEWLSTNPTREPSIDYTYDFTGWSPALGRVTGDVTYTATYEEKQIKYTVVFVQDGGVEIERHLLARDEVPVCENVPTRTGYILQWEPSIEPVVGNQTYTATWLPEPPATYTITFKNYNGTQLEQKSVEADATPTYTGADPTKPATSEYSYTFMGWKPALAPATTNATYVAQFSETQVKYAIRFEDEDGNEIETRQFAYGETPVCSATPTKANTAQYTYSFAWTPQIQTVQGAATYRATFPATTNKYTVKLQCNLPGKCTFTGAGIFNYGTISSIEATPADGYEFVKWQERAGDANLGSVTVNGDITLTAVVKESAATLPGNLELGISATEAAPAASYNDLIITSNGIDASSQIINAGNITTLYGNADYILSKELAKRTWYCVAVPWRVEANGGIIVNGKTAVLGTDIEICYYDGAVRAAQGKVSGCWVYMKNLSTKKVLEPGKAYMIALLKTTSSSITFRKKVQEPLLTTGTSVQAYPSATATDAGWNAIANPSLFHAFVNAGAEDEQYGANYGQVYDSENEAYNSFDMSSSKLVVGQPIYVQAPAAKSIVVANGASYAPIRRAKAQAVPTKYEVSLTTADDAKYADHMSITLNEDKEADAYVIGQDLVKFAVSAKVAQMWIDRYDAKLCINTVAPEGDATDFPLSIFAPKAGNYILAIEREKATEDYALYLTYNGEAIWNLSEGEYTVNLEKGIDTNYGLRVSAHAPQITTGIDEAVVDAKGETRKVLIDNQVFIIRGEKVYSVDGQVVK